jgi:RHH-type proline utilization regulon transcriptional repressor/proline dehydrogenase/delta 1-pyrroline-5-carboxylate dehydrogenase
MGTFSEGHFNNEPDTDWSRATNRLWAKSIREKWHMESPNRKPVCVPVVVAGKEVFERREVRELLDPSQRNEKTNARVLVATSVMGNEGDVERAVTTAKVDPDGWQRKSQKERHRILSRVAMEIRRARGDLIGAAAASTGKIFTEADPEVSEAVDFTEYYPHAVNTFSDLKNVACSGKGVGVVISPWNFPIAIPCGGIVATLATGNRVIVKPASSAILVAWRLCQCFWDAGISKNILQFLPCIGSTIGSKLTNHPEVNFVVLTGGTDTGLGILKERPDLFLAAETGGKNATIVTAMSDRDQAISHVIHSAYSNGGQKCSATSLLILEREVYEDEKFKRQLVDAAKSYTVGSAWNFRNRMGPLIHPPEGPLKRALTRLEPGESWALKPKSILNNPHIWTAGIKWGVRPGSYTHKTEFFGPLLGVMCADNLEHAIELVNETGYGLTSGLESLDEREQEYWAERIKAGNLYINRVTTGAIVLRQPFGGIGKSSLGAGIKAGGPNYVSQFMNYSEEAPPPTSSIEKDHVLWRLAHEWDQKLTWGELPEFDVDLKKTVHAIRSYLYHEEQDFSGERDYFHLRGQDNLVRYLPVKKVVVRLHHEDGLFDVLARIAATLISGCKLEVSIPLGLDNGITAFLFGREGKKLLDDVTVIFESDKDLKKRMKKAGRIRYGAPDRVSHDILQEAAKNGLYISRTKVMMEGRIELLQYYREQSISHDYHRYGNLGERA